MASTIPQTFKQWYWPEVPNGVDGLQLREVPTPQPGSGEVLVRIHAMSLNYRDLLTARNEYMKKLPAGIVPGGDPAGEVVLIGPGADNNEYKVGDRVAATFFLGDTRGGVTDQAANTAIGTAYESGSLAQYRVFRASSLVRIPDSWTYEDASTLACAGVTAYNALFGGPKTLQPGQTVVIQGTGGVSIVAAQIARASGARVILTSSSDEKLNQIASHVEAHYTINYKTQPEWQDRVLELTNGRGAELILDVGGGETISRSLKAVARNGTIAIIGGLSGWDVSVNLFQIIGKAVNIRGIFVGDRPQHIALSWLMELHNIKPVIAKVYTFGQTKEALNVLEKQDFIGKIVVKVSQD
ncbi:NAD(P)-binding protein [Auriculariales sp. MPI-PUGE-AT-0066]|nr:NAD(P)-binding protein [Auriculariales sp. MPI-PUGE-AT-0066]